MEADKYKCVHRINTPEFREAFSKATFKFFGVNTHIVANASTVNKTVYITDGSEDVDKKMRHNKLLKALFNSAQMEGDAWMEEETENVYINVYINVPGYDKFPLGKILIRKNNKFNLLKY